LDGAGGIQATSPSYSFQHMPASQATIARSHDTPTVARYSLSVRPPRLTDAILLAERVHAALVELSNIVVCYREHLMNKNKALERMGTILAGFEDTDFAYIFGSFLARDDFNDIDVAIYLSKELAPYERLKLSQRVARALEKGVEPRVNFDVRILNYAPLYFQYEIIRMRVAVMDRDRDRDRDRRVDYEAHLISEYLDLKYMYDYLDREFLART
jgi:uncharacterized protein